MAEEAARRAVAELPLLRTSAGPRDREGWAPRLKEEYRALIQYVENNKRADNDWFRLESNAEGTRWFGKCWYVHELLKYEFAIEFDIPVTYPSTAPEIAIPELDGKTAKMYSWARGWLWRSPTSSPKASSSTRRSERWLEGSAGAVQHRARPPPPPQLRPLPLCHFAAAPQ
ncbi:ubiquitin-fold modifier-conjugating enzyme 1 isoform X1 [Falco rusticolus]|uniref:ubiquitin-fold modifier-conjugating enzyme 1 isoform X1 n=1 Tax=Falco rusticolus TaxID=120794 RepID=UPI0018866FBA|nr:ubiquitin-fold modifier-conjugating enzyme 1 isoform X1 [Falco rusticolus]XP_055553018.1 ubiquitin-fold modifier-conjugating enzyme 1 isoform X1 [Falco cherrug]